MTLEDYLTRPVSETTHEAIIDGTEVICNYLWCNFRERFDSVEDAETAAEIHEGQEE